MAKPTSLPEWATDGGADVVEPSLGQKQTGWVVNDRPPAGWLNWWQELVYDWTAWIDEKFDDGTVNTRVACHGIESVSVDTNYAGGIFEGNGNGPGVAGLGDGATGVGAISGSGVFGVGADGTSAPGVHGLGGSSDGTGVRAQAVGDGYGLEATAITAAAVRGVTIGIGPGVYGSSAAGYGGHFLGDSSSPVYASLLLGTQDAEPTSTGAGQITILSTGTENQRFRVNLGGNWYYVNVTAT